MRLKILLFITILLSNNSYSNYENGYCERSKTQNKIDSKVLYHLSKARCFIEFNELDSARNEISKAEEFFLSENNKHEEMMALYRKLKNDDSLMKSYINKSSLLDGEY